MKVLATFMNWLDSRHKRRLKAKPYDHAARLSVRKLEERQVLSVTAAVVHGVLDLHVTDVNQTITLSVDKGGHLVIDGNIGGNANQHLVLDSGSVSSIHISSDSSTTQSVVFDGAQSLHLTGSFNVDGGFSNIAIDGTIQANGGINLVANDISLSSLGDLTSLGAGISLDAAVDITMASGSVIHSAHQEIQILGHDGVTIASTSSIEDVGGMVIVDAGSSGTLNFSGSIDVSDLGSGNVGGTVHLLGEDISLYSSTHITADGEYGGGRILIGGDLGGSNTSIHNAVYTYIGRGAIIDDNAITHGSGGTVVVWSDESTQFYGTINATGGTQSGNGGFVEISGEQLQVTGFSDLAAPHGATGTMLLDPGSVDIIHGAAAVPSVTMDQFTDGYVNQQLASANLVISTAISTNGGAGNQILTVDGAAVISWSNTNSLTLIGTNAIVIDGTISNTTASGALALIGGTISINNTIDMSTGRVVLNASAAVSEGGSGTIVGSGLLLLGSGPFALTNSGNDISTLAADTTGAISYRDTNDFVIGIVSSTSNVATLGVSSGGNNLTLQTGGTVTQSQLISASGLELLGSGTYVLTNASNDIATLAASTTGAINYLDSNGFTIGTVNSTVGVTTTNDVTLKTSGTVTQSQAIVASGLELLGGAYTLTAAGNDIATLAAVNTGTISYRDTNGFAIGAVNSTVGVTTSNNVTLQSAGAVTQTQAISVAGLELLGSGSFTLTNANNNIGALAANTTNAISIRDTNGFSIGTVNTVGVTTTNNLRLQSSGSVTQSQGITASGLELLGSGSYALSSASNDIGTLAANTTNVISYRDANTLSIGTVNSTTGTTTTNDVTLQTGGALTLNATINAGATGVVTLNSAGSVTQAAGDTIVGSGLLLLGSGPYVLTDSGNDITTLSANTTGAVSYRDSNDFVIGIVNATLGVSTGGNNLTLQTGGTVTQSQLISAAGLELLGSGSFALTNPSNDITTLAASTTGAINYLDSNGFTIGSVNSTVGVTTTNDVTLKTSGTVTQSQAIVASGLELLGGAYTLTAAGNDIATLAAVNTGTISYRDTNGFAIGTVNSTVGVTTSNNVTLQSAGAVTQTQAISVAGLELLGSGSFTLTSSNNNITVMSANTTNTLSIRDASGLVIGTVNSVGVTTTNNVTLQASGPVTQTQGIVSTGLELLGSGSYTLTSANNDVGTLAANTTNVINYRDSNALSIGSVNSTTGITTTNDVALQTSGGSIDVNSAIVATGSNTAIDIHAGATTGVGSVTIGSAGSLLTSTAGSEINVTAGATSGNITLAGAASNVTANDTVTLAAASGSITGLGTLAGSAVKLSAAAGINDGTASHAGLKTSTANVAADDSGAGIVNIANTHASLTTVTSLTTVGADLTFTQTGGGDLTFTGTVSSGSSTVNGGNILIEDAVAGTALTIANTAILSTAAGSGGGLTLFGASLNPNSPPIFGTGNITIIGGAADTVVNSNLMINGTVNIYASRDVIIGATVTTINPNADINLVGDFYGSGTGGVEVLATGSLNSERAISISGSDVFATGSGVPDSVRIVTNGAANQILAVGNITVAFNAAAPAGAIAALDGQIHSTNGNVSLDAVSAVQIQSPITADLGDVRFQSDVILTGNERVNGGGNVTFDGMVNGDVTSNNRTLLVNAGGTTTFAGAVGNTGVLASLTTDAPGTTDLNGGTVNATTVDFKDDVVLTTNTVITGTTVTFQKAVNDQTANAYSLSIDATGTTTFEGTVGNTGILSSLTTDAAGTTDLNGGAVKATAADFKDDVILTANTTVTATTATFEKAVNSQIPNAYSLQVNASGTTSFDGAIGNTGVLTLLTTDAVGTTVLSGGTINVTTVDFNDDVTLTTNTTVTGTNVTFGSTVNDQTANADSLLVNASGVTTFMGAVGNTGILASLTTDGAGTTDLNGGTVNATAVDFKDDVVLSADTTVTGTTVTFEKTINDQTANAYSLLINASGTTTFDGAVGNTGILSILTTDAAGITELNGGTINATTVDFKDDVILTANSTVAGTTVTFEKTVNSQTPNAYSLQVNASGSTTFDGMVGNTGTLSILTTDAIGVTDLSGGVINATTVDFKDDVILTTNTVVTGTTVTFEKSVNDQTANAYSLLINASGTTTFDGAVGNIGSLSILTTDAAGITDLNGGPVSATTADFKDDVILTANTTVTGTTVTFEKTINSQTANAYSLLVNASGTTTFDGAVGNTGILAGLTTSAAGNTDLSGGTLNATTVDFKDDVMLTTSTTITGTTVTFEKTVNDQTANAYSLLINASGVTTFEGAIGNTGVLATLTTDAAGSTDLNGQAVNVTTVDFKDDVVLTANTTVAGTTVTFEKSVNDQTANAYSLSINAAGTTTFDGAVGNTGILSNLAIQNSTDVSFQGTSATINVTDLSVTNSGSTSFDGTATIHNTMVVQSGGNIIVNAAVGSAGSNTAIDLQSGVGTLAGSITLTSNGSLLTNASGSDISLKAGSASGNIVLIGAASNITANDVVTLTASSGSITGLGTLTGTTLQLAAKTGINDGTSSAGGLHTSAVSISAGNTEAFAVNISNSNSASTTVTAFSTVGADLTFTQSGGGDLTFTGAVTSGSATVNGGNIFLENSTAGSALTIATTATLSSANGSGGGLTISGAAIDSTTAPVIGAGNITIIGGSLDTIVNSDLTVAATINISALRDVIIGAIVRTTNNPNASINVTADTDGDGIGGVEVLSTGQLNSAKDVTIRGSDLFVTPAGLPDSVRIDAGAVGDRVVAVGNIDTASNAVASVNAVVVLDGPIHSTNGNITLAAKSEIQADSTITADVGSVDFKNALQLTGNVSVVAGANLTFEDTVDGDATANNRVLTVNATGTTTFDNAIGATGVLSALTIQNSGDVMFHTAAATLQATDVTITNTGSMTFDGTAIVGHTMDVQSGGNITVNAAITAADTVTMNSTNGSITGLGSLAETTLHLKAATGINDGTSSAAGLNTSAVNISADNTGAFAVNIANTNSAATTVTSLTTVGADLTFVQSGGGDLTFTGLITSGSGSVAGGNIHLENTVALSTLTIANSATLSSETGTGGALTISGATIDPSQFHIGKGDISIIGGALDTIVSANLSNEGSITIEARRDVIIGAVVETTGGGNITLTADTDKDGVGGIDIQPTGQLISDLNDISISGSNLSTTAAVDSVLIEKNPNSQMVAHGNITVDSNPWAPSGADVIIQGQMTATTGTILISAAHEILLGADLTVGTALDFQQAVQLTDNVTLTSTGGGNITFERALTDAANSILSTSTIGDLYFQGDTHISTLNAVVQPNNITFGKVGGPAVTDVITQLAEFKNLGRLTVGLNAGDDITFVEGLTHTLGATSISGTLTTTQGAVVLGKLSLDAIIRTQGQNVTVQSTTLMGNSTIDTNFGSVTGANVTFGDKLNSLTAGIQGLTLNTGSVGDILFNGIVGGDTRLGELLVENAQDLTAALAITATSIDQKAGTGTTTFNGAVNTNSASGIDFTTKNITVNTTMTTTGTGGIKFTNAGLLTINGNISSDGQIVQDGVGAVTITTTGMRTITTTGDQVSFLQSVKLTDGNLLSIDTTASGNGAGGNVTFHNTLDASNAERLTVTAGTGADILFVGAVGSKSALGDFVITDARNVTESAGIVSASLTQLTGTGLTELDGAVTTSTQTGIALTNGAITVNNTATAPQSIALTALNGDITFTSTAHKTSTVQTTQANGLISMTSLAGGIVDAADANIVNVITNSLMMRTMEGIGSTGNALQTSVALVAARNSGTGNIRVDNLSANVLTISSVGGVSGISNIGPGLGDITVTNNASIVVSDVLKSPTNAPVTNATGGNITLMTKGGAFDITINSPITASGGNGIVTLQSGHNVTVNDTGVANDISVVGWGTVYLNASNQVILGSQDPNSASDQSQFTSQNDVVIKTQTGSITNTLPLVYNIQSPQMTSTGVVVLSMNVGRPGETNITVTIYWGDGNVSPGHSNVEIFTGLVGGKIYTFTHTYGANPNTEDKAAPILVNVQVAHDPHVVITALNVNTTTQSVPDIGVDDPPPVPSQNINFDLGNAIYNPNDPYSQAYLNLHQSPLNDKILQANGTVENPGVVFFQDTSIRATVIPVPGEGLNVFPFDTTPPVVYLHFPERVILPDSHEHAATAIVQVDSTRLEIANTEDVVPTERIVYLDVYSADNSVERVRLSEEVLDDLIAVIGKLPDGRYRFLLQEPGETRLRVLLELFEVRQGKIVDDHDSGDRPPSSGKKTGVPMNNVGPQVPPNDDAPVDAEEAIRAANPDMSAFEMPSKNLFPSATVAQNSDSAWSTTSAGTQPNLEGPQWSSVFARQVWERAERMTDEFVERTSSTDGHVRGSDDNGGIESDQMIPGFNRGARLFRKYATSSQ